MVLIHKIAGGNLVLGSKVMLMCRYCHLAADLLNTEGFEMMTQEEFISKFIVHLEECQLGVVK